MKVLAVGDKIITKEVGGEDFEKTDGGIYVPEMAQHTMKPYYKGEVISVGEEVTSVKIGDVIYSAKNWGQKFIVEKVEYKTYGLTEIFGVVREDE